jgi:Vitamin B12 dependent methionine synthase, activation domain
MSDEPQVFTDLPLAIDPAEVLRFQGYKAGRDVPSAAVRALFDDALAEGRRLMVPRAVARWGRVSRQDADGLETLGERLAIPGITDRWGGVEYVAATVCTIGDALERRVSALWEARELPLASMLDSVGSGAVESLAEYVNDLLCQQGLPTQRVTNRISPGYGDWDVAEQRALFRLCPGEAIGVTLNEACVMTPGKSISLLVGAGAQARVDHYFSQCARCWMRDCAYRRVPAHASVRR